jgi:hypothetical protein
MSGKGHSGADRSWPYQVQLRVPAVVLVGGSVKRRRVGPVEGVLRGLEQDLALGDLVHGDDDGGPVVHPTTRRRRPGKSWEGLGGGRHVRP